MTIGLKMAEKRHFEKVTTTTTDKRTAHGLLIVGPELKVRIRQKGVILVIFQGGVNFGSLYFRNHLSYTLLVGPKGFGSKNIFLKLKIVCQG